MHGEWLYIFCAKFYEKCFTSKLSLIIHIVSILFDVEVLLVTVVCLYQITIDKREKVSLIIKLEIYLLSLF